MNTFCVIFLYNACNVFLFTCSVKRKNLTHPSLNFQSRQNNLVQANLHWVNWLSGKTTGYRPSSFSQDGWIYSVGLRLGQYSIKWILVNNEENLPWGIRNLWLNSILFRKGRSTQLQTVKLLKPFGAIGILLFLWNTFVGTSLSTYL